MNQMSPTNALSAQILKIANDLQSGTLPSTTQNVMHLMGLKSQLEKANAMGRAQQMAQQPQPTVKDQVLASAVAEAQQAQAPEGIAQGTASNGIDHLQTNLPTKDMAQGGIIAFDEGGEVQHFANQGLVQGQLPEITQAEFDALPAIDKMNYMQGITPQQRTNANVGARMTYGAPFLGLKSAVDTISNASKDFFTPSQVKPNVAAPTKPATASPVTGTVRPASADAAGISSLASDFAGAGKDNPLLTALDNRGVPDKTKDGAPSADALDNLALRLTKGSRGAGSGNERVNWSDMTSSGAEWDAMKKPDRTIEDFMADKKTRMGENKGLTERELRLKKMEEETNTMEEKSPWLALMKAGIGTMKGTSQFALANIGAGAEEGLNDYIKAQDKIATKKEKIYDAQTNLADARRNEELAIMKYGEDSKQALDAHNNTVAMHKIADKQATEKMNKEGAFNASKANAELDSADSRASMAAGVQLAIAKQDNEMRKYVADLTKTSELSTKLATAYHQAAADTQAELTAIMGTKGVDPMGMGAVKSIAEASALYNKLLLKHQIANGLKPMLPPSASTGAESGATLPALTDKTAASFFR
jgi:hypothetical protein